MTQVLFGNTMLRGLNKAGELKPDANGYYTVVLGALGVENSAGEIYTDTPAVRKRFEENSALMRRISKGMLKGEYGHPDPSQYPSMRALELRARHVREPYVSHHIAQIWLENIDYYGSRVLGILGRIKPAGPYGSVLQESLNNPEENVCFSGRYFSNVELKGGQRHRHIHTVVTWDFVNEPGIDMAQKYLSPSLEEYGEMLLSEQEILASVEQEREDEALVMENGGVSAHELAQSFNIHRSSGWRPKSFDW